MVFVGVLIPTTIHSIFEFKSHIQESKAEFKERIEGYLHTVATGFEEPLWNFSPENAQPIIDKYLKLNFLGRIHVVDSKERDFVDVKSPNWTNEQFNSSQTLVIKADINHQDRFIGRVSLTISETELEESKAKIFFLVLRNALLTIFSTLLTTFFIIKYVFLGKVLRLKLHADRLKAQRLNMAFDWAEGDELNDIGTSLEKARSTLNEIFINLRHKNNELANLNQNLEQEVHEKSNQIVESSRLASLAEMSCGVAHEINSPLAIISAKARKIRKLLDGTEESKQSAIKELETVDQTIIRITKIINGLKTFSRNGDNDPFEKAKLKPIIEEVLAMCQTRYQTNGVHLKVHDYPENLELTCRAVQLGQVILNLLNNAHDAIETFDEKWVELKISESENQITISITDSGKGIPEHVRKKLMQPFFTTKGVGKGTGLGLSISKGIIENHQGKFYLDNQCKNTRFVIELPKTLTQKKAA